MTFFERLHGHVRGPLIWLFSLFLVLVAWESLRQPILIPAAAATFAVIVVVLLWRRGFRFVAATFAMLGTVLAYLGLSALSMQLLLPAAQAVSLTCAQWLSVWALPGIALGIICGHFLVRLWRRHRWQALAQAAADMTPDMVIRMHGAEGVYAPPPAAALAPTARRRRRLLPFLSAVAVLFTLVCLVGNLWSSLYEYQMYLSLNPELIAQMPDTVNDRLLPRATAREMLANANKDTTVTVPDPHLLLTDAVLWQSALQEQYGVGRVIGSCKDVLQIEAQTTQMHPLVETGKPAYFPICDQSWVTNSAFYARHPFSYMGERVFRQREDGSWALLISYISYRPGLFGGMLPYLAGVMEVDQNATIRDLSVDEAARQYPGLAFFPTDLARRYAAAYARFHEGLMSGLVQKNSTFMRYFVARKVWEISEPNTSEPGGNPAPYIQHYKELGLQEMVALHPDGDEPSDAQEAALYFDAATGKLRIFLTPNDWRLNGPRNAVENSRKSDPSQYNEGQIKVEPRQVVAGNKEYWLLAIIAKDPDHPGSHAYIRSVIVDAETLDAYPIKDAPELEAFLKQQAQAPHQALQPVGEAH